MGLMISGRNEPEGSDVEKYTVTERVYLDAAGRLVPDGDPNAVALYSTPGKRIPMADARRLGLVDVEPPEPDPDPPAEDASAVAPETAVEPPAEKKPRTTKAPSKASGK